RRVQAPAARARRRRTLMPLSEELRDELAQIAPLRGCCRLAELSALFHVSGAWHLRGGSVAVHLDLASSAAARRAFALLRDLAVHCSAPARCQDRATPTSRSGRRRSTAGNSSSTSRHARASH